METYIPVRKSQIFMYKDVPLYYHTKNDEYSLYKPAGQKLDESRLKDFRAPALFIYEKDRKAAVKEIGKELTRHLEESIADCNLQEVKVQLKEIYTEAFSGPLDESLQTLPETIEILFGAYSKTSELLKSMAEISSKDYDMVNHSINVMALTMRYCFYCHFSMDEIKRLGFAALLHDIGNVKTSKGLLSKKDKLTDTEFERHKKHTAAGYDIICHNKDVDKSLAIGAFEHHERLDGSGYPRGITDISFEGQLLGLIDSYEFLSNRNTSYRKSKSPFEALSVIKTEIVEKGKFNKALFKDLCLSLS